MRYRTMAAALIVALSGCMAGTSQGPMEPMADPNQPQGAATDRSGTEAGNSGAGPVRFIGRFDERDPAAAKFAWPASAIEAQFTGNSLDVKLGMVGQPTYSGQPTHPNFDVSIDGQTPVPVTFVNAPGLTHLADGLGAGPHTVRLTKITEANQGVATFAGFVVGGGSMLPAPLARPHALEFIGDSGATGYGANGTNGDTSCRTSGATQDSDRAYPAYLAAMLDADFVTVAFSGKGITRNLAAADNVKTLPVLFNRILPEDPTSTWDFGKYTPDAVIIDAGGNDLDGAACAGKMASDDTFVSTYVSFLSAVHGKYPKAALFVLLTTSGCDADRTTLDGLLQRVVRTATAAGLPVTYAPLPKYDATWGLGCDAHPNAVGARHLAEAMAPTLKAKLGW